MVLNKISAWSKFSRKSRGPSAPRRVLLPSAVFGGTSLLWLNKAIGSVWSPVNSLLGFHSPLLALYSHILFHIDAEWHVQNVLRAQLTFLTNCLSGKSQLRRPATLGDEAPDAYLIGIQSIACWCLQLKFPL